MGTSNFALKNASKYYANFPADEWDYEDTIDWAQERFKQLGWDSADEYEDYLRSFPGKIFAEKSVYVDYCGSEVEIKIKAIARSGYYEGFIFDYDFETRLTGWFEDKYDEPITPEIIIENMWIDNPGLCKIHAKHFADKINAELQAMIDEAEKEFENLSDNKLKCVGIFSNGEAVYEAV